MGRLIVCGSRKFKNYKMLERHLDAFDALSRFTAIVHGNAEGADKMAGKYAVKSGLTEVKMKADWDKHGNSAGAIRNREMATAGAEAVVAFWDFSSSGTKDMIKVARQFKIPVFIVPVKT